MTKSKWMHCVFRCVYVSTDFVCLSVVWTLWFAWVSANTASCCAHFRHSPDTRGAPSALSASAASFTFWLSRIFSSSHSLRLSDRSFLRMKAGKKPAVRRERVKTRLVLHTRTWGWWPELPRFQSAPCGLPSDVPDGDSSSKRWRRQIK